MNVCMICSERYAVVTGANKGIGFETVKELASNGVKVVLTARDEDRGHEAIERLKECALIGCGNEYEKYISSMILKYNIFGHISSGTLCVGGILGEI